MRPDSLGQRTQWRMGRLAETCQGVALTVLGPGFRVWDRLTERFARPKPVLISWARLAPAQVIWLEMPAIAGIWCGARCVTHLTDRAEFWLSADGSDRERAACYLRLIGARFLPERREVQAERNWM